MKGVVIASRFWTHLFSARQARAITIFPFIFVAKQNDKTDRVLLNHERIHLAQALELLIIPFYSWYLLEFLIHYWGTSNFHQAYMSISFEKEAFANEHDLKYLERRKLWSFRKYTKSRIYKSKKHK